MKARVDFYRERSKLNDFKLPLYFIPGCNARIDVDKALTEAQTKPDNPDKCADKVFNFRGYPTILIYNKHGRLVYKETGYDDELEKQYKEKLEKFLDEALANN